MFAPEVVAQGSIVLTGHINITSSINILGPGADLLTIDAQGASRLLNVSAAGANVTVSGLTFTGGNQNGGGGAIYNVGNLKLDSVVLVGNTTNSAGGAVYSHDGSTLTINNSTLQDNEATGVAAAGTGGAVSIRASVAGALTIENSALVDNDAKYGGAIDLNHRYVGGAAVARIVNTTLAHNEADQAGAFRITTSGGGTAPVNVVHVTIAANNALASAGGGGVNAYNPADQAPLNFHNTIIADNTAPAAPQAKRDFAGAMSGTSSHNLVEQGYMGLGISHGDTRNNQVGVDPALGELGLHGGTTPSYALLSFSEAIDAGSAALAAAAGLTADQRGFGRNYDNPLVIDGPDGATDIGAHEFGVAASLDANGKLVVDDAKSDLNDLHLRIDEALLISVGGQQTPYHIDDVTELEIWGWDGDDVVQFTGFDLYAPHLGATVHGGADEDLIWGTMANDRLFGGIDDDDIYGLAGADQLFGSLGLDSLFGGDGRDVLDGGADSDSLAGGDGEDGYVNITPTGARVDTITDNATQFGYPFLNVVTSYVAMSTGKIAATAGGSQQIASFEALDAQSTDHVINVSAGDAADNIFYEDGALYWTPPTNESGTVRNITMQVLELYDNRVASSQTLAAYVVSAGVDTDDDGATDLAEFNDIGSDAADYDTDGDLLADGFEFGSGLNPMSGDQNSNSIADQYEDWDADGLTNLTEQIYGTDANPFDPDPDSGGPAVGYDTDDDGVNDGAEVNQGSDPNDASDGGEAPSADEIVEVTLSVGDRSLSRSERYDLIVGHIRHQAAEFGQVTPPTAYKFRRGENYPVRIVHRGTDPNYTDEPRPDYDYTAQIGPATGETDPIIIEDEQNILGVHDESESFFASGKTATLHIPLGNLTAHRPRGVLFSTTPVDVNDVDEEKVDLGPGIRINGDDDDANGVADFEDTNGTGIENDLIEVLIATAAAGPGPVRLKRSSTNLQVWKEYDKAGGEIEFPSNGLESDPLTLADGQARVFVEWVVPTHGDADLSLIVGSGTTPLDTVKFHTFKSIVAAFGGNLQAPFDPENGMQVIAQQLYETGYDAWIFDESDLNDGVVGSFPYNEVIRAIEGRKVSEVAIMGYSQGGGATYLLTAALAADRQNIAGEFNIPFTAYIDGVKQRELDAGAAEDRLPPGWTADSEDHYHYNIYQPDLLPIQNQYRGTHLPGASLNDNVEEQGDNPDDDIFIAEISHTDIDDIARTQNHLLDRLRPRVPR